MFGMSKPRAARKLLWLASVALATAGLAEPALAQAPAAEAARSYTFNIPPQSLARTLTAWAQVTGVQVAYAQEEPSSIASPGVSGSMSADAALGVMTAGTGFTWRYTGPRTVTLERLQPGESAGARVLGPVRVEGQQATTLYGPGGGNELAYRNPTTEGTGSYTTGGVTAVGKSPLSLREAPRSVSVVTSARIEDQQLTSLSEVLRNTPGVVVERSSPGQASIYIRGFSASTAIQVDGVSGRFFQGGLGDLTRDTLRFDRVEIQKGPAALFSGSGQPGGVVNLVRKQPQATFGGQAGASADTFGGYRVEADVTGPLTASKSVSARIMGMVQSERGAIDRLKRDNGLLVAQVKVGEAERSNLLLEAAYDRSTGLYDGGFPVYSDGRLPPFSRSTFLGANWNFIDLEGLEVSARAKHPVLGHDLTASVRYADRDIDRFHADASGALNPALGSAATTLLRNSGLKGHQKTVGADVFLSAEHRFERVGLEYVAGLDFSQVGADFVAANRLLSVAIQPLTYNAGVNSPARPAFSPVVTNFFLGDYGTYGNARLTIGDRLALIGGGRLSWYESKTLTAGFLTKSRDKGVFTGTLGVTYDLRTWLTAYGSYADIFESQGTQLTRDLQPLEPRRGEQAEIGLKAEWLEGRLNGSLALFDIRQRNRAIPDPNAPPTPARYIAAGEYRSKGVEFELNGNVTRNLQISFGYTFNDLEIELNRNAAGQPVNEGLTFAPNVPRHLVRGFAQYSFTNPTLDGLSLGVGVTAQSAIASGVTGTVVRQDRYALFDVFANYSIDGKTEVSLAVRNLSDERYLRTILSAASFNYFGDPRAATITLRRKF